jgi:hypothetical protein
MSTIADKQALLRGILRRDLGTFNAKVFQTVSPGDSYDHTWSHDALTHALMQVHRGEIRRLVVTMPPRSGKSIFASVGLIAWWLGHDPRKRFVCTSYSFELAVTLARQFRSVTTSDWYQLEFPNVQLIKDTETECVTSEGGGRFAIPIGGSFMGRGGDVVVIDDPIKSKDAQSEKARRGVNDWFRETLLPRLDDKKNASIILLMQRLNEDDLAGMLLQEDTWSHLNLPAIAEEDQDIAIGPGVVYHRKQTKFSIPNANLCRCSKTSNARWAQFHFLRNFSSARFRSKAMLSNVGGSSGTRVRRCARMAPRWCRAGTSPAPRRYWRLERVQHVDGQAANLLSARRLARAP